MIGLQWDEIVGGLCISLALTLLLELVFAVVFGMRSKKDMLLVCLVNTATNPVVVFHFWQAGRSRCSGQCTAEESSKLQSYI